MKIKLEIQDILYKRLENKAKSKKKTIEEFILDTLDSATSHVHLKSGFYYCMEHHRLYNIRHAEITLTKMENKLVKTLIHKKGDVVHFDELINEAWGNNLASKYSLRNLVLKIRAKTSENSILSHSGKGYNIPIKQKYS